MTRILVRWSVVVILIAHGLLHLLGAAKGLAWAPVATLTEPIEPALGVVWLAAAIALVTTGALFAARARMWWVAGIAGLVISQAVILTSWSEAQAGTLANVVLLVALGYELVAQGHLAAVVELREVRRQVPGGPLPVGESERQAYAAIAAQA